MKLSDIHRLCRKTAAAVLWTLPLVLAPSCLRERFEEPSPVKGDAISLIVREGRSLSSKSAESHMEKIFSRDSVELYLEVTENDMPLSMLTSGPQTKGAPVEGDAIGDFHVTAYLSGDLSKPYFDDIKLTSSDGDAVGTGYYWPVSTPETRITFFGYAKNQETGDVTARTYDPENLTGSFSYTLPAAELEDDRPADALPQPDLLFAIAPQQKKEGGAVALNFHHALSAIVFKVGDIPADFRVEDVTFTGLPESGECGFSLSEGGLVFDWNPEYTSERNFTQTFSKQMSDSEGVVSDALISTSEKTFMMIPGTIPDDSELIVTVGFQKTDPANNTTYEIRTNLKNLLASWTPGKLYTYKISSPEEIEAAVDDEVTDNGSKKQNLTIQNTGLARSYMRVMLVGYWAKKADNAGNDVIVAQWNQPALNETADGADGTFVLPADFDDNWVVDDQGFCYFRHPVPAGEFTEDLFESYTLTGAAPSAEAELVLSIAVQAVKHDKISETGWPVSPDSNGILSKK